MVSWKGQEGEPRTCRSWPGHQGRGWHWQRDAPTFLRASGSLFFRDQRLVHAATCGGLGSPSWPHARTPQPEPALFWESGPWSPVLRHEAAEAGPARVLAAAGGALPAQHGGDPRASGRDPRAYSCPCPMSRHVWLQGAGSACSLVRRLREGTLDPSTPTQASPTSGPCRVQGGSCRGRWGRVRGVPFLPQEDVGPLSTASRSHQPPGRVRILP